MRRHFWVPAVVAVLLVPALRNCSSTRHALEPEPARPSPRPVAKVAQSGAIDCFEKGLKTPQPFVLASKYEDMTVALSSIECDRFGARLYMLTSFEAGGAKIGGYLWTLGMRELQNGEPPDLVRLPDGNPLKFTHKPEAVTVVDASTVLVVHDDDRVTGIPPATDPDKGPKRELHQSFYDVVRFE